MPVSAGWRFSSRAEARSPRFFPIASVSPPPALRKANPPHRFVEIRRTADDLDFQPQVIQRQRTHVTVRDAHRVLLRRHETRRALLLRQPKQRLEILVRIPIVIEKTLPAHEHRAEIAQTLLNTLRSRDAAERQHAPSR